MGLKKIIVRNWPLLLILIQPIFSPSATAQGWWNKWKARRMPTSLSMRILWNSKRRLAMLMCQVMLDIETAYLFSCTYIYVWPVFSIMLPHHKEEQKEELKQLFVRCTKMDVRVNNIMSRARPYLIFFFWFKRACKSSIIVQSNMSCSFFHLPNCPAKTHLWQGTEDANGKGKGEVCSSSQVCSSEACGS